MIDAGTLDWDDVRVFLAAAQVGGLAAAARALRLSQATVGRRLRRLEGALGARLFDRLPNRLTLTPAGEQLALAASTMRDGAAALARRASALTAGPGATVRISATTSVSLFLAVHMGELLAANLPEIAVLSTRTPVDLAEQDAEIALRMRKAPERGSVAARRVAKVAFAVYAQRDYWQSRARGDPWRTAEVIGLPRTSRSPSQSRWLDDAAGTRAAIIRLRLGEVFLRHHAVRAGLGVSLLPCFLGDADPTLVRVIEPPPALAENVFLIVHEDMRRAEPVRTVADALVELFRRSRDALAGVAAPRSRPVINERQRKS